MANRRWQMAKGRYLKTSFPAVSGSPQQGTAPTNSLEERGRESMDPRQWHSGMTAVVRISLLTFAVCHLTCRSAEAIAIIAGPTLTGSPVTVTSESGLINGVTVQLTLDTAGQVQITFSKVSPVDSSLTPVAVITKNVPGNVSTPIFWSALWLIG